MSVFRAMDRRAAVPRSDEWLTRKRSSFEMRRRMVGFERSYVRIEQRFFGSSLNSVLATAASWFVSLVHVGRGEMVVRVGNDVVSPGSTFLLYLPPRAIVRMSVGEADVATTGFGGVVPPISWPTEPCVLRSREATSLSYANADAALRSDPKTWITADHGCDPRIVGTRGLLIDAAFTRAPVGRVAKADGWNVSVLSRRFTQAYGISPRAYCQRLRVHTAVMHLFTGIGIGRAAFASGFTDLSQFYRQFRRVTGETPGRYRGVTGSSKTETKRESARWSKSAKTRPGG
ncbi:MAG: helix-turn-helix domain-containing protein [Myxococcota bacterium]